MESNHHPAAALDASAEPFQQQRPHSMNRSPAFFRTFVAALGLCVAFADAAEPAYRIATGFPQLPAGLQLAAVAGVAVDSKGQILVFHRAEPPILVLDAGGSWLRSYGEGLFKSAHGMRVDGDDNLWVTDNANHTVIKLSPDGRVLMTLGVRDVAGADETHFDKPTDVAVATNGDFFVADGYGNSRVVKFNATGKFLKAWGTKGKAAGEFHLPHAVRLDSKGQVYVGDRENNRVQVFDQEGHFVRQFGGFAPYGLFITKEDVLFVADGRANKVLKMTLDGKILAEWGSRGTGPGDFTMPHGITVGPDGAVYVGEVGGKRLQKFVPQ